MLHAVSAGRDVASVKRRGARKVQCSVQCSHFSGNICPPVGMEQFISFKQRWSKETALLGLSVKKKNNLTHYISVIFFFWIWVLSHTTRPSLTALGNRLMTMETFFPFPPRSIWSLDAVFWVYWTRWVSSLFPLHPQVILVSEISVSFFSTSVCTCEQGNHGEGATCLGSHSESRGLCLC